MQFGFVEWNFLATIVGLPSWTLIALVRLYQFFLSPFLGDNAASNRHAATTSSAR